MSSAPRRSARFPAACAAALLAALALAACARGAPTADHAGASGGAAAGAITGARETAGPAGPDPYRDLVVEDPHGRPVRFRDFEGKVRVIDLWASWCGPCRMTIPELNALYGRYRDSGLVVVGISVDDDPADVLEFLRHVPMRYPGGMYNDGLAALIGQPSAIPTTLVVDRRGGLRRTFVGYVDAGTLESVIRDLL